MALLAAALVGATAGGGGEVTVPAPSPMRIDVLEPVAARLRCPPPQPGEIVVCAADPDEHRLRPLPDEPGRPDSEAKIELAPGATAHVTAEQGVVGGWPSNRVMMRVKLKF